MKVFSIYTDSTRPLAEKWFLATLKDDWDICLKYFPEYKENGDYRSAQWYKILQEKILLLIDAIQKNTGDVILWIDVDFQFFRKCEPEIRSSMVEKDIVFQVWNPSEKKVNTGFMAIRCNEATLSFFKRILAVDLSCLQFGDQDAANQILEESKDLRWGVFSKKIYSAYNMGDPPLDIIAHHACATRRPFYKKGKYYSSVDLKIQKLQDIKNIVSRPVLFRIKRRLKWLWGGVSRYWTKKDEN